MTDSATGLEDLTRTGVPVVDDVLAGLQELEARPLEERVQALEQLLEGLRGALDRDPGDSAGA